VYKAVNALINTNEDAEIADTFYLAFDNGADGIPFGDRIPRDWAPGALY
jgi:hypothetical protein